MPYLDKNIRRYPVKYLLFTWWENLDRLMSASEDYLKMPILSSGSWNGAYFTQGRIELSEKAQQTANGTVYEYALETFLPGNFPELSRNLSKYMGKHLVLLEFEDGQRVMLGNEHIHADFSFSQSNTALGAQLNWSCTDTQSIQEVEWIHQFQETAQGMLRQIWGDDNTYSLDDQGMFTVVGPDSPSIYIDETKLVQE